MDIRLNGSGSITMADRDASRAEDADSLNTKLDARGRRQVRKDGLHGDVDFLLRTDVDLTPDQRGELRDAGCEIHFAAGNVLTAAAAAEALPAIAELPFVRRIELSRPMFEEQRRSPTDSEEQE